MNWLAGLHVLGCVALLLLSIFPGLLWIACLFGDDFGHEWEGWAVLLVCTLLCAFFCGCVS